MELYVKITLLLTVESNPKQPMNVRNVFLLIGWTPPTVMSVRFILLIIVPRILLMLILVLLVP
jgi:hypothetical protein